MSKQQFTREEVYEKIKRFLVDDRSCEEAKVTEEAIFTDDLKMDSLDLVELILGLEEMVEKTQPGRVDISDGDAANLTTVGAAVDKLLELLNEEVTTA